MKSLEARYIKVLDFHAKIAYLGCNIGTCDLRHAVSFAVPGLAPRYAVL